MEQVEETFYFINDQKKQPKIALFLTNWMEK